MCSEPYEFRTENIVLARLIDLRAPFPGRNHGLLKISCGWHRFVRNVGAICMYAFAGTFISTVAIGATMCVT